MAETFLRISTNLNEIDRQLDGVINKVAKLDFGFNVVSTSIASMTRAFSASIRNVTSLPGISTLQNLVNSISSMPVNAFSSAITRGFSEAVSRYDTLKTFPQVMQAIGYSAEEANKSTEKLRDSILGLPIGLDEVVDRAQMFALLTGDLKTATDLTIALNNAFIASGSTDEQISVGMRQIQYLMEGSKLTTRQWQSLIRSMPIGLRYVGEDLGYDSFTNFTVALRSGQIATDTLLSSIINVGLRSSELQDILEVFKDRVSASMTNLGIAAQRMGTSMLSALDSVLGEYRGSSISGEIKNVSSLLDRLGDSAAAWIQNHGKEISDLIDRIFGIDWERFINAVLDGLLNMGDRALTFVEAFDEDTLGHIITDVSQLADVLDRISSTLLAIAGANIFGLIPKLWAFGSGIFGGISAGESATMPGAAVVSATSTASAASAASGAEIGLLKTAVNFVKYAKPFAMFNVATGVGAILTAIIGMIELTIEAYRDLPPQIERWSTLNKLAEETASSIVSSTGPYMKGYSSSIGLGKFSDAQENIQGLIARYGVISSDIVKGIGEINVDDLVGVDGPINVWQESALRNINSLSDNVNDINNRIEQLSKLGDLLGSFSKFNMDAIPEELGDELLSYFQSLGNLVEGGYELSDEVVESAEGILKPLEDYIEVVNEKDTQINEIDLRIAALNQALANSEEEIAKTIGKYKMYDPTKDPLLKQIQDALNPEDGESEIPTTETYLEERKKDLEYTQGVLDKLVEFRGYLEENLTPEKLEELLPSLGEDAGSYGEEFINAVISSFDLSDPNTLALLEKGDYSLFGDEYVKIIGESIDQAIQKGVADGTIVKPSDILSQISQEEENLRQTKGEKDIALAKVRDPLEEAIESFGELLQETALEQGFKDFGQNVYNAASNAADTAGAGVNVLTSMLNSKASQVRNAAHNLLSALQEAELANMDPFTLNWFRSADGGGVPSFGTDTVPAMLTPGEYVHRRAVVQHYGKAFMDRINNLDLQGALATLSMSYVTPFATGGLVRSDNRSYRDNHASIVQNFNNSRSDYSFRRANRFVRGLA